MRVLLATYQSVLLLKGGPKTQILETQRHLLQQGIDASLAETWTELRREDVDLVHIFGANIGTYHLAREIHRLGIPMVVTPIYYTRRSDALVRIVTSVDRLIRKVANGGWTDYGIVADICSWARAIIPNTSEEARLFTRGLGIDPDRVTVVPNGVHARFAEADPALFRNEYGLDDFILNVGHIGPERKNVLRLIRALEKINHPAVIIARIEDNEYSRTCLEEAKKNPRLLILGAIPNHSELLASAYAACDVFALPSTYETPGIAALEAALAGAKIVITKNGGTREYFSDLAEYVEPTSWELIHHGIVSALNREKDQRLVERVKSLYLWDRVGELTARVYRKALGDATPQAK